MKVLDFVKRGGPLWTVGSTIFEMRLGSITGRMTLAANTPTGPKKRSAPSWSAPQILVHLEC